MKPDAEFACVACDGRGCSECGDTGVWRVTECPHEMVDAATVEALTMVETARDGHLPVAGGVLDQTEWFQQAFRYVAGEMPETK